MVKQIISESGSEAKIKSWQNFSREKTGLGTELARVYFQDELDEEALELVFLELKEKLPLVQIEKSRTGRGIHVPNKYVFRKPPEINKEGEGVKIQDVSKSDEKEILKEEISPIPATPTEEIHHETEDFFQELIGLMERHGKLQKPKEVDMTDLYRIPSDQETIQLPMSCLSKLDLDGATIKLKTSELREFLRKNFPVE